jgi:hypothetical protein
MKESYWIKWLPFEMHRMETRMTPFCMYLVKKKGLSLRRKNLPLENNKYVNNIYQV